MLRTRATSLAVPAARSLPASRRWLAPTQPVAILALLALLAATPACGGGGGGPGPDGAGQGLVLVSFIQNGVGNLALNQQLEFRFSEAVDPATITTGSLQIRQGPSFGRAVTGITTVVGSRVFFEPQLPGLCDLSDSGFQPDTQYRVTLVGHPEEFSIKNTQAQPLRSTLNFEFHTRLDTDPLLFTDQIAATSPVVTSTSPQNGTPVVRVETTSGQVNQIVLTFSENIDPCTISDATVLFFEYQRGDPTVFNLDAGTGRNSGFTPINDADPGNQFSWGPIAGGETNLPPNQQRIRALLNLTQTFGATTLTITPEFGRFPENALLVLQLTFGIKDFGGNTLVPFTMSFTTENLALQNGTYNVKFEGETPILTDQSTGDVDTARSPNRAQGWLLFAGDGDNGLNQLLPTLPNQPPLCVSPRQTNDGNKDDFDPNADVNLDTGLTRNTCLNVTDGSIAVVWEFRTLRIRSGRTVRIIGVNPAILLVQGSALIENGGRLLARGDGLNGSLTNAGASGAVPGGNGDPAGGKGYAGGGDGGQSYRTGHASNYADSGKSGDGSPSGYGVVLGVGAGEGGAHATMTSFSTGGNSNGGGGGGHSTVGGIGGAAIRATNPYKAAAMGGGGGTYPAMDNRMLKPSAGSGAGGSGHNDHTQTTNDASGGGGGAGGGFVDITCSGAINIFGTIDASGGRGGSGAAGFYLASAGAGGGSGGGIRLLTPGSINLTGAVLTTAGGVRGSGVQPTGGGATLNSGGTGGVGRIALEDGDSLITGQVSAVTLLPNEGDPGFSRGIFDASRFQGGGLTPEVVTDVFFVGPANPTYTVPVVSDFIASIPAGSERGVGKTSILIEVRGYNLKPDGNYDALTPTSWRTVGHFTHSGVAGSPTWVPNANPAPADIPILPPGNAGPGIAAVNGREFLQLRVTFYLPLTMGPFDPGPILDDWTIRFTFDQ